MYKVSNETKPDFSLSGVWVQKDVDTSYSSKITQMNQEESIYGFIANTKATGITSNDTAVLQKYVGAGPVSALTDPTNLNRIILKTINQNYHEPIKANVIQNTVNKRLEIRVTYTANGISKILDEYGNTMTLTEENGIILADTGNTGLAKGTYYFTVIDNKGNQKELSITPNVDSLFKVAYISGTDNMDINKTYTKTQETKTAAENTLLNQIRATDTTKTFSKAISSSGGTTAIGEQTRTSEDEKMYLYGKYIANKSYRYSVTQDTEGSPMVIYSSKFGGGFCYYSVDSTEGVLLSGYTGVCWAGQGPYYSTRFDLSSFGGTLGCTRTTTSNFYKFVFDSNDGTLYTFIKYTMRVNKQTIYSCGDLVTSGIIALDGTYTIGSSAAVHKDGYWYVRNSLAPKYTLYKYDQNLNLKSTYDVDTKTLTTKPIDISNKEDNKLKLTLNMYSSNYKVYISNDNTNWQQVTNITSGTPKELDVDGWDKLYVKVETNIGVNTNTTRINDIDIAYYKD